jgi:heterodisulfide reductase subunit A2
MMVQDGAGSVLIVGGGISGMQAALDLANSGFYVYLIEKSGSIGGMMAQLDKTFPTNDCAMCILSPKLVEVGSHPYITIITNAEVTKIEGAEPHFHVTVRKRPRYVNEEVCTGCGICVSKCPTKIPDPYNKNLNKTKCIHIPFPQAIPAIPIIDKESCRYFKTGKCRVCEKVCQVNAIDFEQKEEILDIDVAGIILACGTEEFDVTLKNEYGYKLFPNVITSIEFERILSASGPTSGHVVRPSDGSEPHRIAILQCVGSRDVRTGNDHCSAICCMQAAKDAIIAREHLPEARATIFYMDIRAYGKSFDEFVDRAKNEHHTRFICGRISSVESNADNNLIVQYVTQEGEIKKEEFDLLVLSVGLQPTDALKEMAKNIGTETDERGFINVHTFSPVDSSRPGIFTCGSISGPKDIPESVMEASSAASAIATLQGELTVKPIKTDYPSELDTRGEPPAVGVFVCRCGINIASVVDVPGVVESISRYPGVVHAQELLFTCSQDSQKTIKNIIEEKKLNRVVVAACTPRTHEPLFQKTLKESGVNPYLFEFANIREQCSWVHQKEPEKATEKAKDLVRNAVVKVILSEPLYTKSMPIHKDAAIIGGGLAGMTAALDLAKQGYTVHLIEKEGELGGNLRHIKRTLSGEETGPFLHNLIKHITSEPKIHVYENAKIKDIHGFIGNFTTTLENSDKEISHGVTIIASGGVENKPAKYFYGEDKRVMTQRELDEFLHTTDDSKLAALKTIVMIQCVGSRDEEHPYCSRVCCESAIKNAIRIKENNPRTAVIVLYRDIRTYGLKERSYRTARSMGVKFIRYNEDEKPIAEKNGSGFTVSVLDRLVGKKISIHPDLLVLSTGVLPNPDNKELSQLLKVPLNQDGFFLEAHVKLKPVDFATDGVFVCGLSHYPKNINETIVQGRAAAGRAATILSKDTIEAGGKISYIREERCSGCGTCVKVCPYSAIEMNEETNTAFINDALCKGCGVCAASCRSAAIDLKGFRNEQILAALNDIVGTADYQLCI